MNDRYRCVFTPFARDLAGRRFLRVSVVEESRRTEDLFCAMHRTLALICLASSPAAAFNVVAARSAHAAVRPRAAPTQMFIG